MTAAAKLLPLAGLAGGARDARGPGLPYAIAAIGEILFAMALQVDRTSRLAATFLARGFLGAAGVTVGFAAWEGPRAPCRCLGDVRISHGTALLLQGVIVLLAGSALWPRLPTPDSSEHGAAR